jgi:hypothetical protein
MSCHECVDVCDWNALAWTAPPKHKHNSPKRIKKNTEIFPLPDWQAIHIHPVKEEAGRVLPQISGVSIFNAMVLLTVISVIIVGSFL